MDKELERFTKNVGKKTPEFPNCTFILIMIMGTSSVMYW